MNKSLSKERTQGSYFEPRLPTSPTTGFWNSAGCKSAQKSEGPTSSPQLQTATESRLSAQKPS